MGAGEEERGDLIHFYNHVYIKQMRLFALRYSAGSPSAAVCLFFLPLFLLLSPILVSVSVAVDFNVEICYSDDAESFILLLH